jgi:CheY-like chemotaxis protein
VSGKPLKTILLVDDKDDIREVAKVALEVVGDLTVLTAASGAEALRIAATQPVDLILLDVMMPEMDGPAVLASLRDKPQTAEIPVIFLTAKALPWEIEELRQLGSLHVLLKPFDPMTLADTVKELWLRWQR